MGKPNSLSASLAQGIRGQEEKRSRGLSPSPPEGPGRLSGRGTWGGCGSGAPRRGAGTRAPVGRRGRPGAEAAASPQGAAAAPRAEPVSQPGRLAEAGVRGKG